MTTTDYRAKAEKDAADRFARETARHELMILHDDGLYRHLRFASPKPDFHTYDLITWPDGLTFRGDGPNFVFSLFPTTDLFDMFRGSSSGGINPGYWQEKVRAGQVRDWSEDKFRAWVVEQATKDDAHHPGLFAAVYKQILHSDEHSLEYRGTAEYAVASFRHGDYRLHLPNPWDENFEDWSWEFLWACHGILAGIAQYDAAKAPAPAEAAVS